MKRLLLLIAVLALLVPARAQKVTTIAGVAGVSGMTNATGTSARFNGPHGMASDKAGNVYITDRYNNRIRKIAPNGVVSTLAGTGVAGSNDGPGATATFNEPWGIACDTLGNIYVADTKSYKIRKIDVSGTVTTLAGTGVFGTTNGTANVSSFGFPTGIATTRDGSTQYVTDYNTHTIRKINGGMVSTLAGMVYVAGATDGTGLSASFNHPYGIAIDNSGNLLVSDEWNNSLRKVTPLGAVTTYAGNGFIGSTDGAVNVARFNYPWGIVVDSMNNIYVMDGYNFTIRKIQTGTNIVSTYAGTALSSGSADGVGAAARFNNAAGITYNRADHSLYVADCNNHTIRKVVAQSTITLVFSAAGNATVCGGDSIHLTATPSNLTYYSVYEGTNPVGLGANGILTIAPLPAGVHVLNCTALDNQGAIALSNTITITVLATFVPTISGATSFCTGDSIQLTAQTGTAYIWNTGATTPSLWVKSGGNYTVSLQNSSGCRGTSAIHTVTALTRPTATISSAATQVCPNDSLQLSAPAGNTYLWSNGATTQNVSVPAGTYTVTVTASNGCSAKSSALAITNYTAPAPTITPSGTVTIVQGDSAHLTASGGTTFTWSNAHTGNSVYVTASGTYTVSTVTTNGCITTSVPVQVIVINAATLLSATGPTTFCEGYNVVLQSMYPTGNQWYFNGNVIPGANAQQYTAIDSGYYSVSVVINGNTIHSDSLLVTVKHSPATATVKDTSICEGASVYLSFKAYAGESYQWYDAIVAGTVLSTQNHYQTPAITASTTYYIESIGANGCHSVARAALNVSTIAAPVSSFTSTSLAQSGQYIANFTSTSTGADSYYWIFGDTAVAGNTSTEANPFHTYPAAADYPIVLITTNANGCTDTLSTLVRVSGNNALFIPTTFTPNGDGKNDLFRVRGDHFVVQEMLIYDQWGTVIYQTETGTPVWDGRANGELVENGTYVYKIRIVTDAAENKYLTGPITVIK